MSWYDGLLIALLISVIAGALSYFRTPQGDQTNAVVSNAVVDFVLLSVVDMLVAYQVMPPLTVAACLKFFALDIVIVAIVSIALDIATESFSLSTGASLGVLLVCLLVFVIGYNSGHDAHKAATLVHVSVEGRATLPASSTSNMVVVSPDIATTKARQAMSAGIAGQRNYNTYLDLGPATEEFVDGHMFYVFPLHFDGSGNKHRLHDVEPGYLMVSAEDPGAEPVEHYDGNYSMIVCDECGQGNELTRYVYSHGYSGYQLDDPTLELDDQGNPYWTVTLQTPHLGWTYYAPTAMVVVNAHTGQITEYPLNKVPAWVDRVYGPGDAEDIANWFGTVGYNGKTGWKGIGQSNANRFQVSGNPVMVYTGDGHPDWRMLLTSFNSDSAVSKIVLMDAHSGAMRVYQPEEPMGIEGPVVEAFDSASGQGANLVKANHYRAVGLTLHVIYGHLTWMATYEPEGNHPSFVGLGFVDAYHAQANNVVFGDTKSAALQNYITQLASEGTSNGNAPEQGVQIETFTGKIAAVSWDVTNGQKFWYITLQGDRNHIYVGTVSAVGPAIVLAQSGDSVTMTVQNVGIQESTRTMQSFTDSNVPLAKAGS